MPKDKKENKEDKKTKISGMEGGSRINDMSSTAEVIEEIDVNKVAVGDVIEGDKTKKIKIRGKKYLSAKKLVDPQKFYPLKDAIELLKKVTVSKFDGTVETHILVLNKGLTGEVNLPNFKAKAKKVVAFDDSLLVNLKAGKVEFDVLIASAADMPKLLPFAKLLGPKGLMPNPKNGTLVADPEKALSNFSSTALQYKTEKDFPLIHTIIGKVSQADDELIENFKALIKAVNPKNIKRAVIKSTMSPSIKISL